MTFQVSPGVNVSEIDNTGVVPAVSTSIAATVGNYRWGPVQEVVTVSDENELVDTFAAPNTTNAVDFHVAASFLKYGSALKVVREITSAAYNANAGGDATTLVKNLTNYNAQTFAFGTEGLWIAKYPGALGNSLKVSVFSFKTDVSTTQTNFASWAYKANFDSEPGTSTYVSGKGGSNDELHICVIDEDGNFSGTAGTVLEVFPFLSQASDAKNSDGSTNYYKDVINNNSEYIWFGSHDTTNYPNAGSAAAGTDFETNDANGTVDVSLTAGADSAALTSSEIATGFDYVEDEDIEEVSLMICPDLPTGSEATVANDLIAICVARKDCVAFISPSSTQDTASEIKTMADSLTSSSYAVVDSGRLKVYDKYNDQYINIPACGAVAGCCAYTDKVQGSWWSPAGENRGQILGVTQLYFNPNKTERDTLYKAGVNPIVSFPGQGTMLYGDKTHLSRPSAFDRINVRRLFITLEKAISLASRNALFEFNDEFTRAAFVNIVEPFLRDVKGRRGITDFRVVCDTTNNTSSVIDRNEFVADIYIKPARSINFIQLNFIATRTGVDFNEVAG